jgi:hypothetical protein
MIRRSKINVVPIHENKETAPNQTGEKLWWRNAGGTFKLNKSTVIKPNQKFQAYEHEISKAFRDVIIPIGTRKAIDEVAPSDVHPILYTLQPNADGLFDIYNAQGKKMTENALDEETARSLIKELQS